MTKVVIKANVSNYELIEKNSYDVAEVRLVATDENGNRLSFFNEGVVFETKGPIDLIGPSFTAFRGGYVGVYVKSKAETGVAKLICTSSLGNKIEINFTVKSKNIFKI